MPKKTYTPITVPKRENLNILSPLNISIGYVPDTPISYTNDEGKVIYLPEYTVIHFKTNKKNQKYKTRVRCSFLKDTVKIECDKPISIVTASEGTVYIKPLK